MMIFAHIIDIDDMLKLTPKYRRSVLSPNVERKGGHANMIVPLLTMTEP